MKKLIIPALVVVAVYLILQGLTFKTDFNFSGETYSHVKKMRGGDLTNHFYTVNGEDFNSAQKFIQIIETSSDIAKNKWTASFKPLFAQYQLKSVDGREFELAGKFKKAGLNFRSYAAPITVGGSDHMAFYVMVLNEDLGEESEAAKIDIIKNLKNIQQAFN